MGIINNARLMVQLHQAGAIEARLGGGCSQYNLTGDPPRIDWAAFESRRGSVSFDYTKASVAYVVSDYTTNEDGWTVCYVVCHEPGRKYAQVFICDYEVDGEYHYYSPLYFVGHVSVD